MRVLAAHLPRQRKALARFPFVIVFQATPETIEIVEQRTPGAISARALDRLAWIPRRHPSIWTGYDEPANHAGPRIRPGETIALFMGDDTASVFARFVLGGELFPNPNGGVSRW